ncbi:hypothetical protein, partial [Azospirillum palustre]
HPGADPAFLPNDAEEFLETTIREAMEANGHKPAISILQLRSVDLDHIASTVRGKAPNVVIYFGHGRHETGPELLLSATEWVPLEKVADALFGGAAVKPPFWIFWACSLAEGADQPSARMGSAATLNALAASGGVAVMAMRSKIGIRTARPMLDAVIGAFVAGEPLEVAAAYSRAAGLAVGVGSTGRMDDSAPAVWSRSEPVDGIRWADQNEATSSWVTLPLLGAEGALPELETGLALVDNDATALAASWRASGRYFVTASVKGEVGADPAARVKLLATASALRRLGGRTVVPVILRSGTSFDQRLRHWGGASQELLDPRHANREVSAAIGAIARDGLAGLPRLLAIPNVAVLFSEPPDRAAGWEVLNRSTQGVTLVVAGKSVPREAEGWKLDQLMTDSSRFDRLESLMQAAPLACAILGVIERPLSLSDVAEMSGAREEDLGDLEPLLVRVGGRRVLGQIARAKITDDLDPAVIANARQKCIAKLANSPLEFEALAEVVRLHLALGAGVAAAESIYAAWLEVGARWTKSQRRRLFEFAAQNQQLRDSLEEGPLLDISQAAVEVQDTALAALVLDRLAPTTQLGRMRRHALLAECFKADVAAIGSRKAMLRHAEDAVSCAKEVAGDETDAAIVLHQRHNLARLRQYFEHDYNGALITYEDITKHLGAAPFADRDSALLFAACARNSAECLLDPAPRPIDQALRDRIEETLRSGRSATESHRLLEPAADIDYTLARVAEAAQDDSSAAGLLDALTCGETAKDYPLVATIAAARLFWNEIRRGRAEFEWEHFFRRLQALDLFDHAWAVRTAMAFRLRGVRVLHMRQGVDDLDRARSLIEQNRSSIARHPGLSGHDDARVAALTEVAADLINGSETAWRQFAAGSRATMLPADWIGRSAAEIWVERN